MCAHARVCVCVLCVCVCVCVCIYPLPLLLQELSLEVESIWQAHKEEECAGVNWNLFSDECEDAKVCGR